MRWLVLAPKVLNSSSLADMRPLTLVEVGRKLWMGYFMKELSKKIYEYGLLRDSQNGGLKEKGTDTASVLLINSLESARELMVQILVSSWDKKRAFDSVSKNLAKFSLIRLGVPRVMADYVIDHDLDGPAIIRGGYTKKTLALMKRAAAAAGKSYSDLSSRIGKMLQYLLTERGCGQGDVPSTIVWPATFDILLVAICEVLEKGIEGYPPSPAFYSDQGSFVLKRVNESAYVDDLITITAQKKVMQVVADVVSAFSLIFGFDLRIDKLRTFLFQYGCENEVEVLPTIIVRTNHWSNEQHVTLKEEGEFKFVGINHASQERLNTQHEELIRKIRYFTQLCSAYRTSVEIVMTVCKLSVNSVIMYYGTLASWSVAQHKKFDSVMNSLYKKVYKLMPGTANDLLALPNELGGLNCPPVSDKLFESKWAMIQRNFHSGGEKKAAVCDLVQRSNRKNGIHLLPGQGSIVLSTSKLYVSSMLQTAEDYGLPLFVGGPKLQGTSYEQVKTAKEIFELDEEVTLSCHDIITIGDLTQAIDPDEGVRTFIPELHTRYECVANRIDLYNPPQETLMLRPKQCWLMDNVRSWYVAEFLGVIDGRIAIRKWTPNDLKACPNPRRAKLPCSYVVKIDSYSLSTGAGSSCT